METTTGAVRIGKKGRSFVLLVAYASSMGSLICFVLMLLNYPGMNIAFFIALSFSFATCTHLMLHRLREKSGNPKLVKFIHRCFLALVTLFAIYFSLLQLLILSAARTDDGEADIVIILGAGLYGETPSKVLVSRLDAALEYSLDKEAMPIIIVSGGQGSGETISEAEAMSRYLRQRGISEASIWKEDASTSTLENLAFSFSLIDEMDMEEKNLKIAIVTNEFHLYRSKHIASTLGYDVIGVSAKTPNVYLRVLYHFREAIAIIWQFLFK